MENGLTDLIELTRELLDALRSDDTPGAVRLLAVRETLVRLLATSGEALSEQGRAEMEELRALEAEVVRTIHEQRESVRRQLDALRQARSAASAYRLAGGGGAVYLDRAG